MCARVHVRMCPSGQSLLSHTHTRYKRTNYANSLSLKAESGAQRKKCWMFDILTSKAAQTLLSLKLETLR